jgi:dihydrofolate reductase
MPRRKVVTQIATSADGYIARPDGSVDWLDRPMPKGSYGLGAFFNTIDTILWGRKTFDESVQKGYGTSQFGKVKHYVFTHDPRTSDQPAVEFVNEPVDSFARRMRRRKGKNIWMMGGAGLIASFLDAGAIDEFMIHVIPVFIGEGIPLIEPGKRNVELKLLKTRRYSDGVVLLHYQVVT